MKPYNPTQEEVAQALKDLERAKEAGVENPVIKFEKKLPEVKNEQGEVTQEAKYLSSVFTEEQLKVLLT